MTIASDNSGYPPVYKEQGGKTLRVRTGGGVFANANTGLIGSEDQLWGNCPILSYMLDPTIGILYDEPFVTYDSTNDWTLTQVTGGTAVASTTIPGALLIDTGDTTTLHGPQLQRKTAMFIPAANKSIWFEVTVQVSFLTGDFFLGLCAVDTSIIASSSMTTQNRIGFTSLTANGVLLFDNDKAGVSTQTTLTTLVVNTNVALGFFYDGSADTCQAYVNGVAAGTVAATADIPKLAIYPSIVCTNHGTDEVTMTVSALRVFQLR